MGTAKEMMLEEQEKEWKRREEAFLKDRVCPHCETWEYSPIELEKDCYLCPNCRTVISIENDGTAVEW